MAESATLSRTQLLYGFCLSLAALIGFFLADPLQSSSMAVLSMVVAILCWPLFARWHHPLLVFSFHSAFIFGFLPGNLPAWALAAAGGFVLVIFHRAINPELRIFPSGGVPWALIGIGVVVVATALIRGGFGFRSLGSDAMGGKKYVFILLAIMAYFVVVSRSIPKRWAMIYFTLFTLSGLTGLLGHLVYMAGSKFYWLFSVIDPAPAIGQALAEWDVQSQTVFKSTATMSAASAIITILVARFGIKELFNIKRPWRLLLLVACLVGGAFGGFRSFILGAFIFLVVVFFLEGLHKTRYLAVVAALALGGFGLLATYSDQLPTSVQRAISFLPLRIDPHVRQDAQGSLEWRLRMWEVLWGDVPGHLLVGKGFSIDPSDLHLASFNANLGYGIQAEWAVLAGEYHNGPLSVLLPFGVFGVLAFAWLLIAGLLRLRWHCQQSSRELLTINRALFAMFIAKVIFFVFFFGSFYSELVEFCAVLGMAECLNGRHLGVAGAGAVGGGNAIIQDEMHQ